MQKYDSNTVLLNKHCCIIPISLHEMTMTPMAPPNIGKSDCKPLTSPVYDTLIHASETLEERESYKQERHSQSMWYTGCGISPCFMG